MLAIYNELVCLTHLYHPSVGTTSNQLRASRDRINAHLVFMEEARQRQEEVLTQEQVLLTQEQRPQDDGWIQIVHHHSTFVVDQYQQQPNALELPEDPIVDDVEDDWLQARNSGPPPLYKERKAVLPKRKLDQPCPSECSICHDTPLYKDAVKTSCDHYYCKTCLMDWMNTRNSNRRCPMCRAFTTKNTTFRERAPRRITTNATSTATSTSGQPLYVF